MALKRTLLKNGTVLSLDKKVGNFRQADVLIEGAKIAAVGPNLSAAEAEVIDASNTIVMPGFVDSHRHVWEGILRNIATDCPLEGDASYLAFILNTLAPVYRPEDAYVGDLVGLIGAIDAGNDVEKRGLAGTIRADQAENFVRSDGEVEPVERQHAAEVLGQTVHYKQRAHGRHPGK